MSVWIQVFCRQRILNLSKDDFSVHEESFFYFIQENLVLPFRLDSYREFSEQFSISVDASDENVSKFYHPQLADRFIHAKRDEAKLFLSEVDEALESLDFIEGQVLADDKREIIASIKNNLHGSTNSIAFQLSICDIDSIVFNSFLMFALNLALRYDGIVRSDNSKWLLLDSQTKDLTFFDERD